MSWSATAFSSAAEDAILKGNEFVQQKDYDNAVKEYEKAIKFDPKNGKAHLLLGLTYANKGELDKAVRFSQYALAIEPSFAAYHNLGLIYANKGEYQNAVDAYENALKIDPKSADAWFQLGLLHAGNGHFDNGITAYKKAIELNSRLDTAYIGLGSAYYWAGDKAAALQQVDKLRFLKMSQKADELEHWINDKEAKKKEVGSGSNSAAKKPSAQPKQNPASTAPVKK